MFRRKPDSWGIVLMADPNQSKSFSMPRTLRGLIAFLFISAIYLNGYLDGQKSVPRCHLSIKRLEVIVPPAPFELDAGTACIDTLKVTSTDGKVLLAIPPEPSTNGTQP